MNTKQRNISLIRKAPPIAAAAVFALTAMSLLGACGSFDNATQDPAVPDCPAGTRRFSVYAVRLTGVCEGPWFQCATDMSSLVYDQIMGNLLGKAIAAFDLSSGAPLLQFQCENFNDFTHPPKAAPVFSSGCSYIGGGTKSEDAEGGSNLK